MTGTFEGLGVPIYGPYYRYKEDQTETLYVEDTGVTNMAVTTASADNVLAITHTASAAITSGYDQSIYVALNISSTSTGGNATQRHAFAADITINGTHASFIGGGYIYIAKGTATLTSAAVYGLCLDIQELGAVDYLTNLWLQRSSSSTQTGIDSFILFSDQGASGKATTLFYVQGVTFPSYLFQFASNTSNGFFSTTAAGVAPASTGSLKIYAGTTTHYIKLQAS
jgi:hypothetical protein